MPEFSLLDAILLATKAHAGQTRKYSGEPYIVHSLRVARSMERQGYGDELVVAAVLHDVVEDTHVTLQDLRDAGASPFVVEVVDAVTKRPGETYAQFIDRAGTNYYLAAAFLKKEDIRDNLRSLPKGDLLRKRYLKALKRLDYLVEPVRAHKNRRPKGAA